MFNLVLGAGEFACEYRIQERAGQLFTPGGASNWIRSSGHLDRPCGSLNHLCAFRQARGGERLFIWALISSTPTMASTRLYGSHGCTYFKKNLTQKIMKRYVLCWISRSSDAADIGSYISGFRTVQHYYPMVSLIKFYLFQFQYTAIT
jgi:hypothetical protein